MLACPRASLRWSGEHTKIYIREVLSGEGGSHYMGEESTKLGYIGGLHAQPALGDPEHVERALNQSPKNLRKDTVLSKSQEF